jgi:hypothetical protein
MPIAITERGSSRFGKATLSPVILRANGFRFFFYSNESREPPHVHVALAEAYAKYWLDPLSIDHSEGFNPSQLQTIWTILQMNQPRILEAWHEYFG